MILDMSVCSLAAVNDAAQREQALCQKLAGGDKSLRLKELMSRDRPSPGED